MLSGPVRISLRAPSLVEAGVGSLLAPHADRVVVLPPRCVDSPDVDVFDPVDNTLATQAARAAGIPLVALLHHPDASARTRARDLGAVRILSLAVSADELVTTLEEVRTDARSDHWHTDDAAARNPLTVRESEVVASICRGLSNVEIAADLYLSINSVKTYIRTAYRKMGVSRRSQAVIWGIEHGYRPH